MTPDDIKAARKRMAMSQGELASALGYTRQTIIHWEKGRFAPPENLLDRLTAINPAILPAKPDTGFADALFAAYCKARAQGISHAGFIDCQRDYPKAIAELASNRDLQTRMVAAYPDILTRQEG